MDNKAEVSKMLKGDLEKTINFLHRELKVDAEIKLDVYDIDTGIGAQVNGRDAGWAASIIKVPIMVEALRQVESGRLDLTEKLKVDNRLILETYDAVSNMGHGTEVDLAELLYHMIVRSDNTATNMIARRVGIKNINRTMLNLGMKRSMLGHLLCPNVPRYKSEFNPDGSNITCPSDMTRIFRHIYDDRFSDLSKDVRKMSDEVLSLTGSAHLKSGPFVGSKVKAKMGYIYDSKAGADIHDVGIIDNRLIVSIMLNKVGQKTVPQKREGNLVNLEYTSPVTTTYDMLMKTIGRHLK